MANAMERRLGYVTCWQLELQKGISKDKARKILKSIPWKSLGSKGQYPEKNALASFKQKSYVIELNISASEFFTKWDLEIKTNGKRVIYDSIK